MKTGIETVDLQHAALCDLASQVGDAMRCGPPARFAELVEKFEHELREHFSHEEQVLVALGYPWLEQHVSVHESLMTEVLGMRKAPRLYIHLLQEIVSHVTEHDSAWAAWI